MARDIDGREYKILLNPARLTDGTGAVEEAFVKTLGDLLGRGKRRIISGAFGRPECRRI